LFGHAASRRPSGAMRLFVVGQPILAAAAFQAALSGLSHPASVGRKPAAAIIGCPTMYSVETRCLVR